MSFEQIMTNNTNINLDGLLPTHSDSFDTIYIFIFFVSFVFVLATIIIKIFIMLDLERKRLIIRIENEFEQKYARQSMINNELHFKSCNELNIIKHQSRAGKDKRIYDYVCRFQRIYVDGQIVDYPEDEPVWNTKYGTYHYRDKTKEQIFESFANLFF